jgi:hypothetical protein
VTNLDEPQASKPAPDGCPLMSSLAREDQQWSGSKWSPFDGTSVVGNLRHVLVAEGGQRGENANRNRALEKTDGLDESQRSRRGSSDRGGKVKILGLSVRRLWSSSRTRFNFLGLGKESLVCRDHQNTEIVSKILAPNAWAPEFLWLNWILLTAPL